METVREMKSNSVWTRTRLLEWVVAYKTSLRSWNCSYGNFASYENGRVKLFTRLHLFLKPALYYPMVTIRSTMFDIKKTLFPHKLCLFEHDFHNKRQYEIKQLAVLMETDCVPCALGCALCSTNLIFMYDLD
jgi:hypothetical protein